MTGRLGCFFFGLVIGGVLVYASLHFHFIRADDGIHAVPKLQSSFAQTYVDVRAYDLDDWNRHRLLAAAITRAGKTGLLKDAATQPVHRAVNEFLESFQTLR